MKHSSKKSRSFLIFLAALCLLFFSSRSEAADCKHRLGVGMGLVHFASSSTTNFELGAEYECRTNPALGLGGFANHIFAQSGVTILGLPAVFWHPLAGEFYVAASPLIEFGPEIGTNIGTRLATRIPLPVGILTFVPSIAIDFINGTKIYWLGLGIAI